MITLSKNGRFESFYTFLNLHSNNPIIPLLKTIHLVRILRIINYTNVVDVVKLLMKKSMASFLMMTARKSL
ncbi:hypothetical protein COL26_20585 [Bacillus thuringiensis]|uniref:Uncharacterized protein n=1 Tax=Bacillus thuringiensis TaxID=1428 RepID=A0ABD6S125_BACTU|nr:hypothetical protein CN495_19985 [Bacillus thuringiensis]PEU78302.1 hypothetical protein CN411_27125 [Bacillus thuringiensis]PFI05455.1 hypothetical protein COI79_26210 [Bacillus thuringiensis]PFW35751.1 hypothetical protein COL26_20585 [Bacillus thuringiensis]PGY64085.1 hypothetical protein COE44_31335 [Bacillus thuringiensis]